MLELEKSKFLQMTAVTGISHLIYIEVIQIKKVKTYGVLR